MILGAIFRDRDILGINSWICVNEGNTSVCVCLSVCISTYMCWVWLEKTVAVIAMGLVVAESRRKLLTTGMVLGVQPSVGMNPLISELNDCGEGSVVQLSGKIKCVWIILF